MNHQSSIYNPSIYHRYRYRYRYGHHYMSKIRLYIYTVVFFSEDDNYQLYIL